MSQGSCGCEGYDDDKLELEEWGTSTLYLDLPGTGISLVAAQVVGIPNAPAQPNIYYRDKWLRDKDVIKNIFIATHWSIVWTERYLSQRG